jgi:hypothetical protein
MYMRKGYRRSSFIRAGGGEVEKTLEAGYGEGEAVFGLFTAM